MPKYSLKSWTVQLPLMIGWHLGRLSEAHLPFPGQPVELHHLWVVLVSGSLEVLKRRGVFYEFWWIGESIFYKQFYSHFTDENFRRDCPCLFLVKKMERKSSSINRSWGHSLGKRDPPFFTYSTIITGGPRWTDRAHRVLRGWSEEPQKAPVRNWDRELHK